MFSDSHIRDTLYKLASMEEQPVHKIWEEHPLCIVVSSGR